MEPMFSPRGRRKPRSTEHPAELGLVVEDVETGYVGAVVRVEYGRLELEDRHGRIRGFPLGPGYLLEGRPVILTAPRRPAPTAAGRTASGSVAVPGAPGPGQRAPAGSMLRVATTPNSSRRCGARTCGSKVSSWNTSAGWTTW